MDLLGALLLLRWVFLESILSESSPSTESPPGAVFSITTGCPSTLLGLMSSSAADLVFFFGFADLVEGPAVSLSSPASSSTTSAVRLRGLFAGRSLVSVSSLCFAMVSFSGIDSFVAGFPLAFAVLGADFGTAAVCHISIRVGDEDWYQ